MIRTHEIEKSGICKLCGAKGYTHIHHIKAIWHGGDNRIENLIEVCPKCHSDIHMGNDFVKNSICSNKTRKIISEANKKKIIVDYDFEICNVEIKNKETCDGYEEVVALVNNVINLINELGGKMRWSKTGRNPLMTIGARRTIHSQSQEYDEEYRICEREYKYGKIKFYIPKSK